MSVLQYSIKKKTIFLKISYNKIRYVGRTYKKCSKCSMFLSSQIIIWSHNKNVRKFLKNIININFTSEMISESVKVSALNQACLTKHESITWTIPSIVTDVSAIFVATISFLNKIYNYRF